MTTTKTMTTGQRSRKAGKTPLLADKVPLVWGQWPARDVPLIITDLAGKYSFFQPFACGEWNAIQVLPWQERANPLAARFVVGIDRIALPAKRITELASTATATRHAKRRPVPTATIAEPRQVKHIPAKRAS